MSQIATNARAVRDRYAGRLAAVEAQIAADAAADPKSSPDKGLIEERWQLANKLQLAGQLQSLFADEGL